MAANKRSKKLYYTITVDDNTKCSSTSFIKIVDSILSDPRTWSKYTFINTSNVSKSNLPKKLDENNSFKIILCVPEIIKKECNFHGLSCTNMRTKIVYINSNRWKRGAKKSGYSLKDYRIYLINHEVGHVLGHLHKKCNGKGKKIPVMNQATKGIGTCKPNIWPLHDEN